MITKTITITKQQAETFELLLALNRKSRRYNKGQTIYSRSVDFDTDPALFATVKLVNSQSEDEDDGGPWTEAVLFEWNGKGYQEVACTEPDDEFTGEYAFLSQEVAVNVEVEK